jgi:pyridoxamine 5'-phosphate oxidase-like protein
MAGIAWSEFRREQPELAEAGRELLYRVGVGLAFLSTVRRDGGPRLHPICPVLTDSGMYGFIIRSPKSNDLRRDSRFALHSFPTDDNEDAYYLTGTARVVDDPEVRAALTQQFLDERPSIDLSQDELAEQILFEFHIDRCLLTRTDGFGDPNPRHTIWHEVD